METALILIGLVVSLVWAWLNIIATIAVKHDPTLEPTQRKGQLGIVWIFPFVGAAFVLHLVFQHYPDAIPEKWIPWPLKGLVYGKEYPGNRNRDDDEGAVLNGSYRQGRHIGSDGGGDAGGSD